MRKRCFTLIELIVVIAIVGILGSIIVPNVSRTLAKARDAEKKADFASVSIALYSFFDDNGRMPKNYNPGWGACQGSSHYDSSMQELVSGLYLKEIPYARVGGYCYYDYGRNNLVGAIMVTFLETLSPTTTPLKGSCRPFTNDWCSHTISSSQYCVCNPY